MERLQKAAIATGAAAVLLLGGAGTMAYWTDSAKADGIAFNSGTFTLDEGDGCSVWAYTDDSIAVGTLVPGDVIFTECTFELTADGDHMAVGDVKASALGWKSGDTDLKESVVPDVSDVYVDGELFVGTEIPITGTVEVSLKVTVEFPDSITDQVAQDMAAELDEITVTITQGRVVTP